MAVILQNLFSMYKYLHYEISDPRTHQYYIILNPFIIATLGILYHKFIYNWGPKYMENREPFKLEKVLIVYNLVQILLCAYLCITGIAVLWCSGYYNITCQPLIWDDTPIEREVIRLLRMYYVVKILDLMDTVFFVLRKNYRQISFLHVYHHLSMLASGFIALKYNTGGHGTMVGLVNCAVHVVMYSYYLISSINSENKKHIWWKKHITQLQIVQFMFYMYHFGKLLFQPDCTFPKWITIMLVTQDTIMLVIFTNFYIKNYINNKSE